MVTVFPAYAGLIPHCAACRTAGGSVFPAYAGLIPDKKIESELVGKRIPRLCGVDSAEEDK